MIYFTGNKCANLVLKHSIRRFRILNIYNLIKLNNAAQWDEIIKSFKEHDVYYLSDYVKAFEIHGDGVAQLFYYKDENIRAINVAMKRDIANNLKFENLIPKNKYFDLATPYGYGGFLFEGNVTEQSIKQVENQYEKLCEKENIISEYVRFHPVLNNKMYLNNFYEIHDLGKSVTIDITNKDKIWSNFGGYNKNRVRKAIKSGVKIYWGRSPQLYQNFKEIYNQTMDRDHARNYYYFEDDFYESLLDDLKYNSMMFYAVYEDKIIAMSIILFCNGQLHYHFSGSLKEYQIFAPTNLLLYEVACWGAEYGYKTFHLGSGLGGNEDSLYRFKKNFNKNSNTVFSIGKKVYNHARYKELVDLRKMDLDFTTESNFFPQYRS